MVYQCTMCGKQILKSDNGLCSKCDHEINKEEEDFPFVDEVTVETDNENN